MYCFKTDHVQSLINDAQNATKSENVKWSDFTYHNDTCASIGVNICNDTETYVQLHAFADAEEMKKESFTTMYHLTVSVDGEIYDDQCQPFDSREDAIKEAVGCAEQLKEMYSPCFEFDGIMITDRTKSPCGRFDLTEKESKELYGEKPYFDADDVCRNGKPIADCNCC